jgi:hypothetical protein
MATIETVVLVCDTCATEGEAVETHEVAVDRQRVEVDLCGRCYTKVETTLVPLLEAGRKIRRRKAA